MEGLWTAIENKLVTMKTKGKGKFQQLTKVVSEFLDYATDNLQALEEYLDSRVSEAGLITDELGNHFGALFVSSRVFNCYSLLSLSLSFSLCLELTRRLIVNPFCSTQLAFKATSTLASRAAVHSESQPRRISSSSGCICPTTKIWQRSLSLCAGTG